jgi:serine/threonine protein kinase
MGVIYLARQRPLDRLVALKRLKLRSDGRDLAERFLHEARVAGSLEHQNIVTVLDFFEHSGQPYISMEYLPPGSLRPFIRRGLIAAQVFGVLEGVLAGLAHAESHGIAHRDIKPENVLVTPRGGVKIADFGIAKAYTNVTLAPQTDTGTAVGTPDYMAPEQALSLPVGPYTDLYAVGAMAYEMLAGRTPFGGPESPIAILLRHVNEPVAPLPADVDPRLADWVGWLLRKEPRERPANAEEAWDRLEEIAVDALGSYWRRSARLLELDEGPRARRSPVLADARTEANGGSGRHVEVAPRFATEPAETTPTVEPSDMTDVQTRLRVLPEAPTSLDSAAASLPPPARPAGRRRTAAAGTVGIIALIAAALAYSAAPADRTRAPATLGQAVQGKDLAVRVPRGWTSGVPQPAESVPSLPLREAIAMRPPGGAGGDAVLAGWADTTDPALLRPEALRALGRPAAAPVLIRDLQAYRYGPVAVSGDTYTVYALPTSAGVATIACKLTGSRELRGACDAIAGSLHLKGPKPFGVPPRASTARALDAVLARSVRDERSAGVGAARSRRAQARAFRRLAAVYGAAADRLALLEPAPYEAAPMQALLGDFRRLRREARALAEAAATNRPRRYAAHRNALSRLRHRLPERVAALATLGREGQRQ